MRGWGCEQDSGGGRTSREDTLRAASPGSSEHCREAQGAMKRVRETQKKPQGAVFHTLDLGVKFSLNIATKFAH